MPKLEVECIIRSIVIYTRTPVACGIPKLHKGKVNPPPHRPALAVVGSPFHCMSRWVDKYLMEFLDQTPSCVKNSNGIVLTLRCIHALDDKIFLFAADSTAMCHDINTEEGLTFLTLSLDSLKF